MKPGDKSPKWDMKKMTCLDLVNNCRAMLGLHGFISESENDKVRARIAKWAAKPKGP